MKSKNHCSRNFHEFRRDKEIQIEGYHNRR